MTMLTNWVCPRVIGMFMLGMLLSGAAQATEYDRIDPEKSRIEFGFTQMGVGMDGRFADFTTLLRFDPERPEVASASLVVRVASIDTGSVEANEEVTGKLWFDTASHPEATFVSAAVKRIGDNQYQIDGQLTIKGKTQSTVLPVTIVSDGEGARLQGTVRIMRSDFGIGEGEWADFGLIENEVDIRFDLFALPAV